MSKYLDLFDHVHPTYHISKDNVLVIQPRQEFYFYANCFHDFLINNTIQFFQR